MKPTNLVEHPEGGRYQEVYRSMSLTEKSNGDRRSALTHIYFSLNQGEISHFHKVTSDEIWNLYKGAGLYLYLWDGSNEAPTCIEISEKSNCFCYVVPANWWQAALPMDDTILVGCSVAPGFDFADFTMMKENSEEAQKILSLQADLNQFIVSSDK